ncbi:MAG: DNRLRE domain-containing protein, partial [Gemmatimonadota bacterium]|nr:DNRLRE domain-containing protein [Gemmatimonadota bacterium]
EVILQRLYITLLVFILSGIHGLYARSTVDTLYSDADVTVCEGARLAYAPGGGRQGYMLVGYSNLREAEGENRAYVRFNLNEIDPESIESAVLMLWKSRYRKDTLRVYAVGDDSWEEYGTFWNNAPSMGELVASGYCRRKWSSFEVTDYLRSQRDNKVTFGLRVINGTADGLGFNTREGGAPPMLLVTHSGPSMGENPPNPGFPSTSGLEHGVYIRDNGGSYTECESIRSAVGKVQPGQEIVLGPGVYYESFKVTVNGTVDQPIRLRGDGDPKPVIDGSLRSASWQNSDRGLVMVTGDYWIFEHIEIKNAHPWAEACENSGCLYIHGAKNFTLRDCAVHFGGNGIFVTSSSENYTEEYCEVSYNSFPGAGYEHGHYVSNAGTTVIRFNHFHHNAGMNFKSRSEDCLFAYNYVHSCGNYQIDFAEGADFTDQDAVLIGNVVVHDNPYRTNQQFIVFGENRSGGSLYLYNNTFVHLYPAGSRWITMWFPGGANLLQTELVASNNVFFHLSSKGSQRLYQSERDVPVRGTNNWITEETLGLPDGLEGTVQGTDPGLVDIVGADFRPLSSSPLIDAGDSEAAEIALFEYRYPCRSAQREIKGSSVDIGAFEFDGNSQSSGPLRPAWDFNSDGEVTIADVIRLILDLHTDTAMAGHDVNGDGFLNIVDAVALIIIMQHGGSISLTSLLPGAGY